MNTEELPSKSNLKPPIGAATMNVQMSAVGPHYGTVPCVRLPRREAQVCAPVVEPVAVDVVDLQPRGRIDQVPATGGIQSLPPSPSKAPKPPPEVQDKIQAAAEDRRDRKRIRNLRNIGHSADCAMDMAIGHQPCSCSKESPNA